jgi:hypothetical protein
MPVMFKKPHPQEAIRTAHPNGHFYSPIVDPGSLAASVDQIWRTDPEVIGINFNAASHLEILQQDFPNYIGAYDYPEHLEESADLKGFYTQNSQFSWLDSRALFVLLQKWRPARVIEVGSGFSSLLIADVSTRVLERPLHFTCIEPYPREFLKSGPRGVDQLLQQRVQDLPLSVFSELAAGDILFIDSSHVSKTGSDVNYLFFEVLPRLQPGVHVHVHDIFLPLEYPREWVMEENRSWNEQYLVRALMMYNNAFEVSFGCNYAFWKYPDEVIKALNLASGTGFGGGSFWITKLA